MDYRKSQTGFDLWRKKELSNSHIITIHLNMSVSSS